MLQRIVRRLVRFLRLEPAVYKEIATDAPATAEAALVAVAASLLAGLGAISLFGGWLSQALTRVLLGVAVNWLLWSLLTGLLVSLLYQRAVPFIHYARVLGYASAPFALGVLAAFGCIGDLFNLVGWALALFYGFYAVREVAEVKSEGALVSVVGSSLAVLVVNVVVRLLL